MTARAFSHPNFGKEVRIEQKGKEVALIFVAASSTQAESFAADLLRQATAGNISLTLLGTPTVIDER